MTSEAKQEAIAEAMNEPKSKKAKGKVKAKGKGTQLASLSDFVKGVKGARLASGHTPQGKKTQALKALYRALERRGWTVKGDSMTLGTHRVQPLSGLDFAVSVDNKYQLALGKGAILEVDAYIASGK